jgi:hypothetical protein
MHEPRSRCLRPFLPAPYDRELCNVERASDFFDKAGFRPPRFFVVLTTLLEVTAALGWFPGCIRGSVQRLRPVFASRPSTPSPACTHSSGAGTAGYRIHAVLGDQPPVRAISTQHSAIDRSVGNRANLRPPARSQRQFAAVDHPQNFMPLALLQNVAAASTMFLILASSKGASCAGCRPNPQEGASQSLSSPTTFAHAAARSRIFSTGSTP